MPRERAPARPKNVALEGVHQLVAENVIGFAEAGRKRQHDAAAIVFGDAADTVGQEAGHDVRLRELRVAAVEDDRLAFAELVMERGREAIVPTLGHSCSVQRRGVLRGVVVDIEVRRDEHPEVEVVVVDLVATERLRGGRSRRQHAQHEAEDALQHTRIAPLQSSRRSVSAMDCSGRKIPVGRRTIASTRDANQAQAWRDLSPSGCSAARRPDAMTDSASPAAGITAANEMKA